MKLIPLHSPLPLPIAHLKQLISLQDEDHLRGDNELGSLLQHSCGAFKDDSCGLPFKLPYILFMAKVVKGETYESAFSSAFLLLLKNL
jgi:hypothetical protein